MPSASEIIKSSVTPVSLGVTPTLSHDFHPDRPQWDQSNFYGRFKYFASITDPLCAFYPETELFKAKQLLDHSRSGNIPPGTTVSELYRAQKLFGSAFHPDTGDLQTLPGRMCANVYGSTLMCGGMMIFYRSNFGVFFWQWANQSFNALVNYTNRNAKSAMTNSDILIAYTTAKAASVTVQRLVPLAAVCVANFINIPLMRQNEIRNGLCVTDENGKEVGKSRLAAIKAISLVAISRNIIVIPSMLLTPSIVDWLENNSAWFKRNIRYLNTPAQLGLVFVLFGAMVPVGCALFPQQNSINVESLKQLEPETYQKLKSQNLDVVFFNKGL
uniref:Sidoreflexin n=1 Tax=Panagrolaimus sp. ES5 TaxID=591445 RepID=A0AC34EZD6_9BILA